MKKALFALFCCVALIFASCSTTGTTTVIPPSAAKTEAAAPAATQEALVLNSWANLKAVVEATAKAGEYVICGDMVADSEVGTITIPYGTDITITDDGTARTISRGSLVTELFVVEDGAKLTIKGTAAGSLVLDGKGVSAVSAGINTSGELVAENITFCNFLNESDTGDVLVSLGSATFTGCAFDSNTSNAGAAINTITKVGCALTVDSCSFTNNTATTNGAALNVMNSANLILSNSTFTGNKTTATAKNKGGAALYMAVTNSTITNCTFTDNVVTGTDDGSLTGGAIIYYCLGAGDNVNTIDGCTFSGNGGVNFGGAIGIGDNGKTREKDGNLKVTNCTFNGNSAATGSGIASRFDLGTVSVTVEVSGCTFNNDTAAFNKSNLLTWTGNNIEPATV